MIKGAVKSKIWRVRQQARDTEKKKKKKKNNAVISSLKVSAAEFLHAQRRAVFCSSQDFNWLDEAHPCDEGQSALFKVHRFKC